MRRRLIAAARSLDDCASLLIAAAACARDRRLFAHRTVEHRRQIGVGSLIFVFVAADRRRPLTRIGRAALRLRRRGRNRCCERRFASAKQRLAFRGTSLLNKRGVGPRRLFQNFGGTLRNDRRLLFDQRDVDAALGERRSVADDVIVMKRRIDARRAY